MAVAFARMVPSEPCRCACRGRGAARAPPPHWSAGSDDSWIVGDSSCFRPPPFMTNPSIASARAAGTASATSAGRRPSQRWVGRSAGRGARRARPCHGPPRPPPPPASSPELPHGARHRRRGCAEEGDRPARRRRRGRAPSRRPTRTAGLRRADRGQSIRRPACGTASATSERKAPTALTTAVKAIRPCAPPGLRHRRLVRGGWADAYGARAVRSEQRGAEHQQLRALERDGTRGASRRSTAAAGLGRLATFTPSTKVSTNFSSSARVVDDGARAAPTAAWSSIESNHASHSRGRGPRRRRGRPPRASRRRAARPPSATGRRARRRWRPRRAAASVGSDPLRRKLRGPSSAREQV